MHKPTEAGNLREVRSACDLPVKGQRTHYKSIRLAY